MSAKRTVEAWPYRRYASGSIHTIRVSWGKDARRRGYVYVNRYGSITSARLDTALPGTPDTWGNSRSIPEDIAKAAMGILVAELIDTVTYEEVAA